MGKIKNIYKILLVIQLLSCVLAFYKHPDAELIDFGSPTQPSRDQAIIEAAINRGMDGEAVAELLRTKKPVVRVETTPDGATKTTTYKLEDDGSISRKTVTQKRNRYVYNSGAIPDSIPIEDLHKYPTGTITRTFTNADGNKVTQTIDLSKSKSPTPLETDDLNGGDWFSKPFPSWPQEPSFSSPLSTVHRTITRTYTGPNGEKRVVQSWSSDPETPLTETHNAPNYSHRTITRTYTGPSGERRVVQTTSNNPDDFDFFKRSKFPSIGDINWPTLDESSLSNPWHPTDTENADDWEIVKDNPNAEATTKKLSEWPQIPTTHPTRVTTTTAKPKVRAPLPDLQEFLKSQYGTPTQTAKATTTSRTPTSIPKSVVKTNSALTTQKPIVINVEDLPVVEILQNGKPADESLIKQLPPHLTPRIQTDRVLKIENKHPLNENSGFKIENIHPIEDNIEVFTPRVETNIRTYSKTHNGPNKPTLKDLDPQMQEILTRAGINPEDITKIDGDTITKTRQEPDGRVVTTTYKVNTVPVEHSKPVLHHSLPQDAAHSFNSFKPITDMLTPLTTLPPYTSPISEFLAQLGLTKFDISSKNGRLVKTLIDENGDVLTATFILSSPKGIGHSELPKPTKPFK